LGVGTWSEHVLCQHIDSLTPAPQSPNDGKENVSRESRSRSTTVTQQLQNLKAMQF